MSPIDRGEFLLGFIREISDRFPRWETAKDPERSSGAKFEKQNFTKHLEVRRDLGNRPSPRPRLIVPPGDQTSSYEEALRVVTFQERWKLDVRSRFEKWNRKIFLRSEPEMLFTRKTECNKWLVTVKWINLVASPYCSNLPIRDWTLLWNCFAANHTLAPVRVRRQNTFRVVNFTICDKLNSLDKVQHCMNARWDLNCRMKDGTCYYFVSCKKIEVRLDWECEQEHITYSIPACCEYICPWSRPRPYASIISYLQLTFSLFAYITLGFW